MMDGAYKGPGQQPSHHTAFQIQHDILRQQSRGHTLIGSPVLTASSPSFSEACAGIGLVPAIVAPRVPKIQNSPTIAYRPIKPSDLDVLREIHEALFPIKYEAEFFLNVVNGRGIVSWAAVDTSRAESQCDEIIGFVTARVITTTEIDTADMLGYELGKTDRTLIYILTLGVIRPYRNLGIATTLIGEVIEYASRIPTCRGVYLHVISYNQTAIHFYKKNFFQCLRKLQNFYLINGRHFDAYLYIFYVNGGRSPCSALDFLMAMTGYVRGIFTSMAGRAFWTREMKKVLRWPKCKDFGGLLSRGCKHHGQSNNSACSRV